MGQVIVPSDLKKNFSFRVSNLSLSVFRRRLGVPVNRCFAFKHFIWTLEPLAP